MCPIRTSVSYNLSDDAVDDCYTSMNTRGNVNGHCGFNGATYKPCLERYDCVHNCFGFHSCTVCILKFMMAIFSS